MLQTTVPDKYERLAELFSTTDLAVIDEMICGIHFRSIAKRELMLFGPGGIRFFSRHGIKVHGLAPSQRFSDVSPIIAKFGGSEDDGPHTLAIFVWADRTLYVKDPQPGVFSHELGHALDFCLALEAGVNPVEVFAQTLFKKKPGDKGPPVLEPFASERDERTKKIIGNLCNAISPYGSTNRVEAWAEAIRGYCGVNDGSGLFATISSAKLRAVNRPLYALILETFVRLNGRTFERIRRIP